MCLPKYNKLITIAYNICARNTKKAWMSFQKKKDIGLCIFTRFTNFQTPNYLSWFLTSSSIQSRSLDTAVSYPIKPWIFFDGLNHREPTITLEARAMTPQNFAQNLHVFSCLYDYTVCLVRYCCQRHSLSRGKLIIEIPDGSETKQ